MRRLVLAVSTALFAVTVTAPAWAHHDDDPKFAIHLKTPAAKAPTICTTASPNDTTGGPATACTDYVTAWPLSTDADMYIVIAQVRPDSFATEPANIAGASFGITYDDVVNSGMDIVGTPIYCADGLLLGSDDPNPVFPIDSGSSIRLTWDNVGSCQTQVIGTDGIHAIAMVFKVFAYGADTFTITPNRNLLSGTELAVANCSNAETKLDTMDVVNTAFAEFGGGSGCNPCIMPCPTPTYPLTWGRIKTLYDH